MHPRICAKKLRVKGLATGEGDKHMTIVMCADLDATPFRCGLDRDDRLAEGARAGKWQWLATCHQPLVKARGLRAAVMSGRTSSGS
jgi:hypothetical protein